MTILTSCDADCQNKFDPLYSKAKELRRDESLTFLIIYKVDKKIRKNRFVLYYQEQGGIFKLRKIKLNMEDISNVEKIKTLKYGEFFDVPIYKKEDSISVESVTFSNNVDYKVNKCSTVHCELQSSVYSAPEGYKIMAISFASDAYEAKNMIDFLKKYGRIDYKDSKGKTQSLDINIAVNKLYLGKVVYLKVPEKFEKYESSYLTFTIRNKSYRYQLT